MDSKLDSAPQMRDAETAQQVRANAEIWFRRQVDLIRRSMGAYWPAHKSWVVDYLRQEVRQRLIDRGWRPRDAR